MPYIPCFYTRFEDSLCTRKKIYIKTLQKLKTYLARLNKTTWKLSTTFGLQTHRSVNVELKFRWRKGNKSSEMLPPSKNKKRNHKDYHFHGRERGAPIQDIKKNERKEEFKLTFEGIQKKITHGPRLMQECTFCWLPRALKFSLLLADLRPIYVYIISLSNFSSFQQLLSPSVSSFYSHFNQVPQTFRHSLNILFPHPEKKDSELVNKFRDFPRVISKVNFEPSRFVSNAFSNLNEFKTGGWED